MKSGVKLSVIVWSLCVCAPVARLAAQTSTPAAQLVRLEMHTSAEDLAFLDGEPVLLVGVRPRDGVHRVQLLDMQGRALWEHTLGKGERLGGAKLSSDGKHLVYDYFVHETTRGWLAPHEPVTFRGGVRCVRRDGSIAWERATRGIFEGPPTCSPEGRVEQVAGGKVLILRYGWESVRQVTVRDLSGRQVWKQELQGASAATLSPDGSHLIVSSHTLDANWTRIHQTDGRMVTHLVGASLPYSYPLASWSSRKYLLLEVSSAQRLLHSLKQGSLAPTGQVSSDATCALMTFEGKPAWLGRCRFDADAEPVPALQDEAKDVSRYSEPWQEHTRQLGQSGKQVAILWVEHPRRRLLILESPERERGTLVLQRVAALPAVRRGEHSLLSPDGRLVAIYRVSRDGNRGMLHVHFWNQRGRFLGEVAVSDLPANARGDLPYATRVWITPDNWYFVVWLEFGAHDSLGYCVIRTPAETQP